MPATLRTIWTVGRIARHLNEPLHRVEYAIKARGIDPIGIAGNARVFDDDQVEQLSGVIRAIDEQRDRR